MNDPWLAVTYVAIFAVIGGVLAAWLLARTRKAQVLDAVERTEEYRAALATQSAANDRVARELAQVTDRLTAIEKLLRDVG